MGAAQNPKKMQPGDAPCKLHVEYEGEGEEEEEERPLMDEPRPTDLVAAADLGLASLVRELLGSTASVNGRGMGGLTPLRAAARRGHLAAANELLCAGAAVDEAAFEWHTKAIASRANAYTERQRNPNWPLPPRQRPPRATTRTCEPRLFEAINIEPFVRPERFDEAARARVARTWDETFQRIGFALIEGHGISEGLIGELRAAARAFFRQGLDYKVGYLKGMQMNKTSGYTPQGIGVGHNDPVEGYTFNLQRHRGRRRSANEAHPQELSVVARQYADEMERVMHILHQMSATALGLEDSYFGEFYTQPASVMVLSNYPALPPEEHPQLRYRAHSDYSGFTVLLQDDADCSGGEPGGLEIDVNGCWVPVQPREGCLVVNIGDLFETWTNDRWRSTPHRVRSPPPGSAAAARPRFTTMLFSGPNLDATIVPIRTCVNEANPLRYAPISAADHLRVQSVTKSKEAIYKSDS